MRVLVSNDDGVDAPGIHALAQGLRDAGHDVYMVAPDRDRSGASNSLTLDAPIRVVQLDERTWKVYGTPTDCVHVAITGMLDALGIEPDIVVSGINNTANLGDDVIYSGTVAAAMEGRFLGLPAVAMSLVTRDHKGCHYETAARDAAEIIARLASDPLPANTILNVNVPDLPWTMVTTWPSCTARPSIWLTALPSRSTSASKLAGLSSVSGATKVIASERSARSGGTLTRIASYTSAATSPPKPARPCPQVAGMVSCCGCSRTPRSNSERVMCTSFHCFVGGRW